MEASWDDNHWWVQEELKAYETGRQTEELDQLRMLTGANLYRKLT